MKSEHDSDPFLQDPLHRALTIEIMDVMLEQGFNEDDVADYANYAAHTDTVVSVPVADRSMVVRLAVCRAIEYMSDVEEIRELFTAEGFSS